MSNHSHRRRRRPGGLRIRGAAFVDLDEAARMAGDCACPVVVIPGDPVVFERHHRHACPALARHADRLNPPDDR